MGQDLVVLVDEYGRDMVGPDGRLATVDKVKAHRRGLRHRAVSVFIFNDRNEVLLQKRANGKYHSAGKWSNTCCTHPLPGEAPPVAARRRLAEEMGLALPLTEVFTFSYETSTGNGLSENEFDHVFFGFSNQNPMPDPTEVSEWKWVAMDKLAQELAENADRYSPWLRECFDDVLAYRAGLVL